MYENNTKIESVIEKLLNEVLRSSKYQNFSKNIITNLGKIELEKTNNIKDAIKSTKRKLHQISTAYFKRTPKYNLWLNKFKEAKSEIEIKEICLEVMTYHSSTEERLEIIDEFYNKIFTLLPPIHSILDIACGFNPLSIPWMPIPKDCDYYAFDILKDMIEFLNNSMKFININGHAEVRDVIHEIPKIKVDLALIMKNLPCFEKVDKSIPYTILEEINAENILISFPVKSIGGKEKGMVQHYTTRFNKLVQSKDWQINSKRFKTELIFLIKKDKT